MVKTGVRTCARKCLLDGVKRKSGEAIGQFNAVLFLPQMMGVIEGGPEERRRYLNLALAQVISHYQSALAEYNKALLQRNALLKQLYERKGDYIPAGLLGRSDCHLWSTADPCPHPCRARAGEAGSPHAS